MPIYKISSDKAVQIPVNYDGFGNEFKLRDFFAENLEALLWVRFLEKEYPIENGRMDTIGIDENGCPVIIEYKWKENEEVFAQGLFYLDWLKRNKRHFELLVKSKLGADIEVNWSDSRVILVAQGFSRYVESAVQQVSNVELKTYALYGDGIIHIENVYGGKWKRVSVKEPVSTAKELVIQTNQDDREREEEVSYTVEFHLEKLPMALQDVFRSIQERLLELPSVEEIPYKIGITYRTTRSFVRFEFRKEKMNVLLRDSDYREDERKSVRDIAAHKWWFNGLLEVKPSDDPDYVFNVIKASYESTL